MTNPLLQTLFKIGSPIAKIMGGPLGSLAVDAFGEVLGISEPTEENINAKLQTLPPKEQANILKEVEKTTRIKMKIEMQKYGIEVEDRKSARLLGITPMHWAIFLITYGGIGGLILLMSQTNGDHYMRDASMLILGMLLASAEKITNFLFGSSMGSKDKSNRLKEIKDK